ncbi:MAG TPA: galactokinase [Candidatus Limnocylindrales bacterium]|nr:galactokinase [Candidatus Limnocylindrales bacterium]
MSADAAALARDPEGLVARLADAFPDLGSSAARVVRAPGRVNLIGEHTDYNLGFVLPVAIDLGITIALVPTDDRRVEMALAETGERDGFGLDAIGPKTSSWIDYVAGTAWALADAGVPVRGFRGILASDLPQGSGLSSSAALELASSLALSGGELPAVDRMTLAQLAQRAENRYVGVNCGLMDQFASAFGERGSALLLDCRSLEHRAVPMPLAAAAIVVCHSGSPRRLEASAYNERRSQCEAAVAEIAKTEAGVGSLRDVTPAMLEAHRERLDPLVANRAEHVVRENERVLAAVDAFGRGDLDEVGRLFYASQDSMRDLFGISSPELDTLVEIASGVDGVYGARLTGAGFGGCTVNLVRRDAAPALRDAVLAAYGPRTGLTARVFEVEPSPGAARIS